MEANILEKYRSIAQNVPGWFTDESIFVWDFFMAAQTRRGIGGDFFEIGVYKGKSAVMGALHTAPSDWCVLLDIGTVSEAKSILRTIRKDNSRFIQRTSIDAQDSKEVRQHFGKCRWVHIDGDHRGSTVTNDLKLAAELIRPEGVICVDDFFSFRYPQVTAATYRFVFDSGGKYQVFFAGSNKGYLCRAKSFQMYDDISRNELLPALKQSGLHVQMNRSSHASDNGCFTISFREGEKYFLGLDEDPERMVY